MPDSMSPTKACMLLSFAVAAHTLYHVTAFSLWEFREEVTVDITESSISLTRAITGACSVVRNSRNCKGITLYE